MPVTLEFDEEGNVVGQPISAQEEAVAESEATEPETSDFSDVVAVKLRENPVYYGWKALQMGKVVSFTAPDPDFNLNQMLDDRQVPNEDRSYFEHVNNPEQFETTYDYWLQDKEDEETLKNASALSELGAGLLTFAADPLVYVGLGATSRLGLAVSALRNPIAAAALFAGIYAASSYTVKASVKNDFDLKEMGIDTAVGAIVGVALHGLGRGASKLFKPVKEALKASIIPEIDNMFLQEAGVLRKSSNPNVQKVKRFVWKMFNPTPMWQMYNSGNEQLQRMTPKIFGFRTSNLAGEDAINGVSVAERLNLYNGDALKLSEEVYALREQFIKEGGTGAGFDSEVGLTIAEREIDPNTLAGKAAKKIVDFDNKYIQFGEEGIKSERFVLTKELANLPREEFEKRIRENTIEKTRVTAKRYLKRNYNAEAIDANMDKVGELLDREILLNNPEWLDNPKAVEKTRNKIINSITGDRPSAYDNRPFETESFWASLAKERQVAISDELLLEEGIIQYDSVTNHINNLKFAVIDRELDKVAVSEGYLGWRNRSGNKKADTKYLINDFEIKGREKTGAKRYKTRNEDIGKANKENYRYMMKLLNDTEMLLKGTYSKGGWAANWSNIAFFRAVRDSATCAYSGFLWAAQIPDIAQIGMREGFSKPLKRMVPFIFKKDTLEKIDRKTLYKFLDLLDTSAQATRFVDMGYTPESQRTWVFKPSKEDSRLTRYTRNTLTVGVEVSNWMTRALKRNAAQGIYSDLIEACVKNDRGFLNKMGIDEKQAKTIADLFLKYGDSAKNIKYFDPNLIEDRKLSDQVRASVETLTDEIIASPNAGNIPRMLRSSAGTLIFMFTSYVFMLYNNVFRPLFRGDISGNMFAKAAAASLALSATRKYIVDFCNGKETDWDSLETWKDVYTYSNLDTHVSDGVEMMWRGLSGRNPLGAVSPAYQWLSSVIDVSHQLCRGKWRTRKLRNMFPPLNFGPFRPFTNWMLDDNRRRSSW